MSGDVTLRFADISELDSAVQKLAEASSKTTREVLPAQMRLFAADLAFNTRPIGKAAASQREGQAKVESQIATVYPTVGMMASLLKNKEERLGKAFIALVKKKEFSKAAKLLNDVFSTSYAVGEFDGGKLHKDQQFKRRVSSRLIVTNYAKVTQYIKEKKKLVGFAKGGFATAARQLGGVRGIPGFATRQPAPGSGSVTGDGSSLTVTLVNGVKYIEDALDMHGEERAINFRRKAVDLVLKRMMDRKLKSASRHLK